MKFEEAFCAELSRLITVDDATKVLRAKPTFFAEKVRNSLFCPECRKPKLSFHNAAIPYFSTYPLDRHDIECQLRQDEMTKNQTKEFIKQKINKDAIVRQAESLLAMLLSNDICKKFITHHTNETDTAPANVKAWERRKINRIPRKRIDCAFSEEDYDCP